MQFAEFFCGVAMATHFILGFLVLSRSPKSRINQHFSFILALFLLWSLGEMLLMVRGHDPLWGKILFTPIILLPFIFARFSALFPKSVDSIIVTGSWWQKMLFAAPTAYLLWLLWSGELLTEFDKIPGGFLLSLGGNEFLAKGVIVAYLALALRNLSDARRNIDSEFQERRFRYTLAGLILPASAGSVYIALGRWYISGHSIYTFGLFPILGTIMAAMIGYAILRYQLMEIDLVFSIGLIYTILTMILAGGVELLQNMMQNYFDLTGTWSTICSTLVIAAVFSPLKDFIAKVVDLVFGKRKLDSVGAMRKLFDQMRKGVSHKDALERLLQEAQPLFDFSFAVVKLSSGVEARFPDSAVPQSLPGVPAKWEKMDDIDALIEAGKDDATVNVGELQAWRDLGFRALFPIRQGDEVLGALFLSPRAGRLPFTSQERELLASVCQGVAPILENVSLLNSIIEKDRDIQQLEWARTMYRQIQADQRVTEFQGREIRLFCRLAGQIKGDLIDLCADPKRPFIALCDAFHDGVQAALTLHVLRTALRAGSGEDPLARAHEVLAEFNEPPLRSALTFLEFSGENKLRVTNSGNITPFRLGGKASCTVLTDQGKPLGFADAFPLPCSTVELLPGEYVLCSTNGLAKVFGDEKGEALKRFLTDQGFKTLSDCHRGIQKELLDRNVDSTFADDITYVLIGERKPV